MGYFGIVGVIFLYGLGFTIMGEFGKFMAQTTGNSDWVGIGMCLGIFNPPIFALLFFVSKAIFDSLKKQ